MALTPPMLTRLARSIGTGKWLLGGATVTSVILACIKSLSCIGKIDKLRSHISGGSSDCVHELRGSTDCVHELAYFLHRTSLYKGL